ncbi:effector-associated constant component EACC1 [Streptomyces sp. TRM68367]|uniref:effector-associated constant component EACC1 n=1 Tax=Streptomyces sp. TRM68367 TaxID=2758415 RepID=UPI00165C9911|nr:hypothetical protein [Streptomyces sp. TRM68367]MBC9727422.1 hypothetical protein [Streptomyces sp. TRM68367]
MEIRFEATGQDREAQLGSLYRWLSGDRALRGHVRVERVAADSPGSMGTDLQAVLTVLSTAAALAQLPLSYLAWRESRRSRGPLTIQVIGADPAEAEDLLRRLRADTGDDSGENAPGDDSGENAPGDGSGEDAPGEGGR